MEYGVIFARVVNLIQWTRKGMKNLAMKMILKKTMINYQNLGSSLSIIRMISLIPSPAIQLVTKFSEQMKIDTENFGDFARYQGGRGGRGHGHGGYHGRGYSHVGW
ncbi:uncharacterized protein LOC122278015 [Carya illinoinensis]|uniref:uncharacterized protein LOC122278015 n=1 Tax=Carya illinoinensis TaxID=32201 RepID=UPI001C71DAC7|nr:uncharacterized protein LOC122278015 [Carya illinoinensis]